MSANATTGIPDLWPNDVKQVVVTPLAIMRAQATYLREKTSNLLEAEIDSTADKEKGVVTHSFTVIAPALNRYSYLLFQAKHGVELVYPVSVRFSPGLQEKLVWYDKQASSQEQFVQIVGALFNQETTKSVLSSLLARSNESSS